MELYGANHVPMDDHRYIAIEEALRALQAGNAALHVDTVALREGLGVMQGTINRLQRDVSEVQGDVQAQQMVLNKVQADVAALTAQVEFFVDHYARKVDVEMIRTEFYKAMEAQTWRLFTWMTVVCSGLTAAVYFIARNVH